VEKILRMQPLVKRLYLLVRAGDQASAKERVRSEVVFFCALLSANISHGLFGGFGVS
jgi:fatty acyl-CoA reductase